MTERSPSDFEVSPGVWFGEWLRSEIEDGVHFERPGPMLDRARRVLERLQASEPSVHRFKVEIPWFRSFSAFTAPGSYIYISRRLIERCPTDETVAFVLAHELAHQRLGHLDIFMNRFSRDVSRFSSGKLIVFFFHYLQKRVYSLEWELEADRVALDICAAAGFDGAECLRLFNVMEKYHLDRGDLDSVYGSDDVLDEEFSAETNLLTKARSWLWLRTRGYPPIKERAAAAHAYLSTGRAPFPEAS